MIILIYIQQSYDEEGLANTTDSENCRSVQGSEVKARHTASERAQ